MRKKLTPEEREEIRRINDQGRAARARMQATIDHADEWLRVRAERRERRRRLLRRLMPFRRVA
jgi:hypothetical protein